MNNGALFFSTYVAGRPAGVVADIGAQDVNGSLRTVCPNGFTYVGVDFVRGKGVDVVLDDPYVLPLDDESIDVVVCNSCFEHSEMFWVLFLEIMRILTPGGLFYLNAPSNGAFHRYPVDCWRFYPDSGRALVNWAGRNGYQPALLESYVSVQAVGDMWNDFVAVFAKEEARVAEFPGRMMDTTKNVSNGLVYGSDEFVNFRELPEDAGYHHPFALIKSRLTHRWRSRSQVG